MRKPNTWRGPGPLPPSLDVHRLRVSVRVDAEGNILQVNRGHGPPPQGFVEVVNRQDGEKIAADSARYAVDPRRKSEQVREKIKVHFTVDDMLFLADGRDMAIIVIGGVPEGATPTIVQLNGHRLEVPPGDVIDIVSEDPGLWVAKLTDPRYWASPAVLHIRGLENTPENRRAAQARYDDPAGLRGRIGEEVTRKSKFGPETENGRGVQRATVTVGRST